MRKTLLNSGAIFYWPAMAIRSEKANSYHLTSVLQLIYQGKYAMPQYTN